ncbi:MAG TPA: biosynthetic peptidoglycan transglycosylase [Chroococcales cyanobacterium]
MSKAKRKKFSFLGFLTLLILVALGAGSFYVAKLWVSMPDPVLPTVSVQEGKQSHTVFCGPVLCEDPNAAPRIPVALTDVSPNMVKAILAAEDRRYLEHNGIDVHGVIRATLDNLKDWHFGEGASTISQQLAKNLYLDQRVRNARRKLKQIILAVRLEQQYTKEQILESYLNEIYFGRGAYGIGSAAQSYFHEKAIDLSVGQSAFLAAVVKAPSVLGAPENHEQALARQHDIIENMREYGFIKDDAARKALAEKI